MVKNIQRKKGNPPEELGRNSPQESKAAAEKT